MYKGIFVDEEFDLEFVKHYHHQQQHLFKLYDKKQINQDQLRSLQNEYFANSYQEFFIQRVSCGSDLIELV